MKVREWAGRLNLVQQSRSFRIGASVFVVLLVIFLDAWRIIDHLREAQSLARVMNSLHLITLRDFTVSPPGNFIYASLAGLLLAMLVIWLGQSLTYLGLALVAGIAGGSLLPFPATAGLGRFIIAATLLTMAFAVLKAGMRLLLSLPGQPLAIARNVLDEAVRMKISVVFIVVLVFTLAFLPHMLDESQPLRYRIQTFLQWGTGGAFVILAFLTIFLAISTVAFEQRDRQIWQVITKPVSRGSYLFGKWIGVMSLDFILLCVVGSAVFMFTQYMRTQPAQDDFDRYAVEQVVLTARKGVQPVYEDPRGTDLMRLIDRRLNEYVLTDSPLVADQPVDHMRDMIRDYLRQHDDDPAKAAEIRRTLFQYVLINRVRDEVIEMTRTRFRNIPAAIDGQVQGREFRFVGLDKHARKSPSIILRFKVNSGTNDPGVELPITFYVKGQQPVIRMVALKNAQTLHIPASAVEPDGSVTIAIFHGDVRTGRSGVKDAIYFPPDGLEIMYTVGTFEGNYLRVMLVLWIKLSLLAALGIATATFLSFPVASLFSFVGLFAAESAGFLKESLHYYTTHEAHGLNYALRILIRLVGYAVIWLFSPYVELKPTSRLVEGRYISWSQVIWGAMILGLASLIICFLGYLIFRRRELGTYSGH